MTIKNKKAGIFAAGMVLAMLIFMSAAWFAFSTTNEKIGVEFRAINYLENLKNEQIKFKIYSEDATNIASVQSFYEIAKDSAIDKAEASCQVLDNYIIWSQDCKPESSFTKQQFLSDYNRVFTNLISKYPNENLRATFTNEIIENSVVSTTLPLTLKAEKQGSFAKYSFETTFTPLIKVNLTKESIILGDFAEIYTDVISCSKDLACFNNLDFENWNFKVTEYSTYFLFKFQTKKSFFFTNGAIQNFKPIELNFIIKK